MNIKDQVNQRVKDTEKQNRKKTKSRLDDSKFAYSSLQDNVLGDAGIFCELYRDNFVFNKSMDSWMSWAGHHWQVDQMGHALGSIIGVTNVYKAEVSRLSKKIKSLADDDPTEKILKGKRKELTRRIFALKDTPRASRVLTLAHTSENALAVLGDQLDKKPWLLACENGVINLQTGELEPGRQEDYLLKACPVAWPKDGIESKAELWEKTLLEIFSGRQHLVDFFQRICGYALVGSVLESIIVVMSGQGRNGKSLIVETVKNVLGPQAGAIRSEMLLDQYRVASSSGPTPDLMALRGLRMAFASETDENCRISPSRVKWLTGNDTITGRNPHDKYEVEFKPTHTLFLLTNHKPRAPADDFAFWERVVLIPFDLSFVTRTPQAENEKIADLKLSQKLEEEFPGILAWMVKGCLDWQNQGLNPPAIVKEAVKEYRRDEDSIADFIEECCVVGPGYSVGSTAIYEVFEDWWKINISNRVPKQKRLGTLLTRRFEKRKTPRITYFGVGLLSDNTLLQ